MRNCKEYSLIFLLLLIIISLVFNDFIFGDLAFITGDSLSGQSVKKIMYESYSSWFPYIFSGMPTVHSFLSIQHLYLPHHLMILLSDLGLPWIWNFLFHYIFAGIGMYALLRYLKQSMDVAFFGSFLFMLLPSMIAYMAHGHGSQVMTACYIPWVILFLFKNYKDPSLINISLLGTLIGFQLLRGHVQIAYYTWMMIGLFVVIKLVESIYYQYAKSEKSFYKLIKTKLYIFISLLIGLSISLSLYLPVKSFSELSTRSNIEDGGGYSVQRVTENYSLSLQESLTFIFPYINGFGGISYQANENHGMASTDFPNYISLVIILLAIIGLWKGKISKSYKIFFMLSIIISFLIALGKYFLPFYSIFFNYFPFFDSFRVPVYILIVLQFSSIVLASCGLSQLSEIFKTSKIGSLSILSLCITILIISANISQSPKENHYANMFFEKIEDQDRLLVLKNISSYLNSTIYLEYETKPDLINNYRFLNNVFSEHINNSNDNEESFFNSKNSVEIKKRINDSLALFDKHTRVQLYKNKFDSYKTQIKYDHYFIIMLFLILIILVLINFKYSIKPELIILLISIFLYFDYMRINQEIIFPKNHPTHSKIVESKAIVDNYFKKDELIKFLKTDQSEKFRIVDKTGSSNRFAAFGIENVYGYHADLHINDYISTYNIFPPDMYPSLYNLKYIIIPAGLGNNENNLIKKMYSYREQNFIDVNVQKIENDFDRIMFTKQIMKDPQLKNTQELLFNMRDKYSLLEEEILLIEQEIKNPEIFKNDSRYKLLRLKANSIVDEFNKLYKKLKRNFDLLTKPSELIYVEAGDSSLYKDYNYNPDSNKVFIDSTSTNDRIKFSTDCQSEQFLFISEVYYPGWSCKKINKDLNTEEEVEIYKVNGTFRGISVPKGEYDFVMEFKSKEQIYGMTISYAGYIAAISLLIIGLIKRRKRKQFNEKL